MESVGIDFTQEIVKQVLKEVKKVVVGQETTIENCLVGLLSGGHLLLEGPPGVAKTILVRAFSKAMNLQYNRIQFTPDLMPADVTGTKIFNQKTQDFEWKYGPVVTNLLLADEINRTPPRTQAGLLQVMEEQALTMDGETIKLPQPYMVFATQNPLEYEGTYPLPEALLDRFQMKLLLSYPEIEEEIEVLNRIQYGFKAAQIETSGINVVCDASDILRARNEVSKVRVEESIMRYVAELIALTRKNNLLEVGSSVRGSIALLQSAKAKAVIRGRDFVIPEDIVDMVLPVLRHRVRVMPELEMEGITSDVALGKLIQQVKVPR